MNKPPRSCLIHLVLLLFLALSQVGCGSRSASSQVTKPTFTPPATADPEWDWPSSTPEEQGMDSALLARLLEDIQARQLNLYSFLLIRHGQVVMETYFYPWKADARHEIYSCTKSFTSTLIGLALEKGYIQSLDQPVLGDLLPWADFENQDQRKSAMRLEHLLTMTSGLAWQEGDPAIRRLYQSQDWVKQVLDLPMVAEPGTVFNYCTGCSHVLSAIIQQQTGMDILVFARLALFHPIGLRSVTWDVDNRGQPIGGWGLKLTAREMARLGHLFLNKGAWDGQQVISADWVEQATRNHVATGDELGYGYQWWIYPRHGAYAALGLYGQAIFVDPQLDLVLVTQAETADHGPIFRLIEEYIFPAARSTEPLPPNPAALEQLAALSAAAGEP
jgi:CubicO group peptidase (beta-lactamase class C family)